MGIDISRLGPAAQKQIAEELARREKKKRPTMPAPEFESNLERQYYEGELLPLIYAGKISSVEMHERFELLPAASYCGVKLPAAHYTPDFKISYTDGTVEIVEVKSKAVRKLQGSYVYRRRLFIEKYARPQGWIFTEVIV